MGKRRRTRSKGGGVLTGLRRGIQTVAGGKPAARRPTTAMTTVWNILTALAVLVAGAFLLRRFGVIHF
jgi:hypothetical protein